jgi:hypothetical protein
MMRAIASELPPAGYVTTNLTSLVGYACCADAAAENIEAAAAAQASHVPACFTDFSSEQSAA